MHMRDKYQDSFQLIYSIQSPRKNARILQRSGIGNLQDCRFDNRIFSFWIVSKSSATSGVRVPSTALISAIELVNVVQKFVEVSTFFSNSLIVLSLSPPTEMQNMATFELPENTEASTRQEQTYPVQPRVSCCRQEFSLATAFYIRNCSSCPTYQLLSSVRTGWSGFRFG